MMFTLVHVDKVSTFSSERRTHFKVNTPGYFRNLTVFCVIFDLSNDRAQTQKTISMRLNLINDDGNKNKTLKLIEVM